MKRLSSDLLALIPLHTCSSTLSTVDMTVEAFPSIPLFDGRFGTLLEFRIKLPTLRLMEPALPSETTVNFYHITNPLFTVSS